jgi:ferric-dicitrate binding protein FerR (iron transport regulator)
MTPCWARTKTLLLNPKIVALDYMKYFFLQIVLVIGVCAEAQDVGVVVTKGTVTAGAPGALHPVKVGSRIADGQTVQTGADSLAILAYTDNSRVKLKDNTTIVIHAVPAREPQGFELVVGAVFSAVTKHPDQHFRVNTKVAVAGVRGTQFFTAFEPAAKEEKNSVWMCVQEGQVEMTETTHPQPVLVSAGFGVVVESGKAIAPPQKYAWTKNLNWKMDPADGDVVDKTSIRDEYRKNLLKTDYD